MLCIWRSIETASFIRSVSDVQESGSDVILTTCRAALSDLIKNGNFQLSTELFVNPNAEDQALRYCDDGVFHPSVILFGDTDTDGINEYITADQLLAQNATRHIIDKEGTTNYTFSLDDIKIGLKDVYTHAVLDLEIGIKISWFRLVKFDCYFSGGYKLDGSIFCEWDVVEKTKGGEVVLAYYPSITVMFPIGPFSIPVAVMPTLNMECDAHAKGTINVTIPMEFDSSFKLGPSYARGNGWHFYKDFNHTFNSYLDKTNITYAGSLGASCGIYLKTAVSIAYCGGPYVKVGRSVATELTASLVTGSDYQFKINTNGKFKLDGMVGAELNILGYSLSKWETEYNLVEKDAWNKEFVVDVW